MILSCDRNDLSRAVFYGRGNKNSKGGRPRSQATLDVQRLCAARLVPVHKAAFLLPLEEAGRISGVVRTRFCARRGLRRSILHASSRQTCRSENNGRGKAFAVEGVECITT